MTSISVVESSVANLPTTLQNSSANVIFTDDQNAACLSLGDVRKNAERSGITGIMDTPYTDAICEIEEVEENGSDGEEDNFVGTFNSIVYSVNKYESLVGRKRRDALDVVIVADKTRSQEMYCVHKEWISFKKGCIFVPKFRSIDKKLSPEKEDKCRKQLILNAVKVGTEQTQVCIPVIPSRPRGHVRTRGNCRSQGISLETHDLLLTWHHHFIKVLLRDFCKLCNAMFL